MAKPLERMTRAELIEALRFFTHGENERALRRTILELQVFREEVRQQNDELIGAQKDLEWSRNRYAQLYDSAPIGYVTLDENGVVEEINQTGAVMFGLEVHTLVGRPLPFKRTHPAGLVDHLVRCRRSSGEDVVSELPVHQPDGASLPVEVRSRPVIVGTRRLFRTTLVDLTERVRAEDERRELELRAEAARAANEAKDRFLAILSHELRNPLAAISASVSLLAERAGLPQDLAATVDRIQRNVAAEAQLIEDLLDASRLRHGKLRVTRQRVDVHAALTEAAETICSESPGLALDVSLGATESMVKGDPMRIGQVAANLLRNARDATAGGGKVRLSTSNPAPGTLRVAVSDDGCGIPLEDLERIFDPFEQRRANAETIEQGGLGLGLAISRGLVEAHEGKIRAFSDGLGCGARFEFDLPLLAEAEARALPVEPIAEQASAPHLRILLVDDHHDTAEALALLLEQRGFEVVLADSVATALERAKRGFDVLISDLGLPDGSGRDLVRRLAEQGPLRAIALSGYGEAADLAASEAAGFRAHLVKPVEPSRLLRAIERIAVA